MTDPLYAAPGRLVVAGLIGLLAAIGLLFLIGGLVALADGEDGSWFPALLGLQLTILGVLGVTALGRSRRPPDPVEEFEGGVALPLRRGHVLRQAVVTVTLGSLLLPGALQDDNGPMVVVGSVALAAGLTAAGWLLLRGARNLRIRLTPDGLVLPSGWGTVRRFAWREIEGAQTVPRWQPVLVVIPKDDRLPPGLVKVLAQGWEPDELTRVIEHYVDHPDQRSDLTSAAAVESLSTT